MGTTNLLIIVIGVGLAFSRRLDSNSSSTDSTTSTTAAPTTPPPNRWIPPRDPKIFRGGEVNTIYTRQKAEAIYYMEDRKSIVFRVKACSAVVLDVSGISLIDHEADQTKVVIGSSYNTITSFHHGGVVIAQSPTPQILHCQEFRTFWLRWSFGLLEFGRGPALGTNVILANYDITSVANTAAMTLSPERTDDTAVFEIRENTGDEIELNTPTIYGYERFWKSVQQRNFIHFRVMACSDAFVVLSSIHGNVQDKVYEIGIGTKNNGESFIRTQAGDGGDSVIASLVKKGLLHCAESREFWIGWLNHPGGMGTIQVGQGHMFGESVLMKVTDPNLSVNIRHLSISTGNDNIGEWAINDDLGDVTTFKTKVASSASLFERYEHAWVSSYTKQWMTFYVTAASDAYIHISTQEGVDPEFGLELIIGGGNGQYTTLRTTAEEGALVNESTPNILSADGVRLFWLSWKDGFIKFGKGRIYDTQQILQAQAPSRTYVALSFSSVDVEGLWRVKDTAGTSLLFQDKTSTPQAFTPSVWRTVSSRQRLSFMTMSCSNISVMLSPTPGSDDQAFYYMLQLSFTDKSYSTIERCLFGGQQCNVLANGTIPPDGLKCGSIREMYVTWYEGRIVVGRGRFPTLLSTVMEADSHSIVHHVHAVAMATAMAGPNDVGWAFRQDEGDHFIYHTSGLYDFKTWIRTVPGLSYVLFEVTAASEAHVRLKPETGDQYVEVIISGWNNRYTVIMDNIGFIGANVTTIGYLNGQNGRTFWISWDTGLIRVGGGSPLLRSFMFASWENPRPFNVSYIGISTGEGYSGLWTFPSNIGMWTRFPSHVAIIPINMEETWRTVEHSRSILFTVRAPAEVHVTLSEQLGVTTRNAVEVALGAKDNSVSVIRRPNSDSSWVTADTPGILDKDKFKDFWISWTQGVVEVGRGGTLGQDRILQYQVIPELNIRGLRFSTTHSDDEGMWQLPMWDGLAPIVPQKIIK